MNTGWMTLGKWMMSHPPLCDRLAALEPSLGHPSPVLTEGPVRAALILFLMFVIPLTGMGVLSVVFWPKLKESFDQARNQALQPNGVHADADTGAQREQVKMDLQALSMFVDEYYQKNNSLPQNAAMLSKAWKELRPVSEEPSDPFDGYQYGYSQKNSDYYLWSSGPDCKTDTDDDIVYHGRVQNTNK
jgi:hypothetical protein